MSKTPKNDAPKTEAPKVEMPVVLPAGALVPAVPAANALALAPSASEVDVELLDNAVARSFDALAALATDSRLPTAAQASVRALVDLASPNKRGMEEMVSAWQQPRMHIVQPTTQSDARPETARNGDLFTSTGQSLGTAWKGILIYMFEENVNFPEQSKVPACSAPDAKLGSQFGKCVECPYLPYGKQRGGSGEQQKTDCNNQITAIMLAEDLSQVYSVSFAKTSRKAGTALKTLARAQPDIWAQSYTLTTEKGDSKAGLFYLYKVVPTGVNNSEAVQLIAARAYDLYKAERDRRLALWYARPAAAVAAAAAAEGAFLGGAFEASLGLDPSVEPDLGTTAPVAAARNAAKPM